MNVSRKTQLPTTETIPSERSLVKSVALPTEHGGWSLTLEPVVLALLIKPSLAGLYIGLAAFLAFLARTPLRVILVDRFRQRSLERTKLATRIFLIESALILALMLGASLSADSLSFWIPIFLALPLIIIEFAYDMKSKSRRLVPELLGTIGISVNVAAITIAGGIQELFAFGLFVLFAIRGVAAIVYVRTQIFRIREKPTRFFISDLTQVFAFYVTAILCLLQALPWLSLLAMGIISFLNLLFLRREPPKAKIIGIQQMIFGILMVSMTAIGFIGSFGG